MSQQTDIYSRITQLIIDDLEKGELTWRRPWSGSNLEGSAFLPLRSNGIAYTGVNIITLWLAAYNGGFTSPYWMTFKQAADMKAHVKKGEKGSLVIYADKFVKEEQREDGTTDSTKIPFLKQYVVFNASQIEGLPEHFYIQPEPKFVNAEERDLALEDFFAQTNARMTTGTKASYNITLDKIEMPPFETFNTAASYYATFAHELAHWTRHPRRLDRDFNRKVWGDEGYAKEELVAELGSCFLAAQRGFAPKSLEQHAAYIQSWLKVLKDDKRFIVSAAAHAQRAVEYLMALQGQSSHLKPSAPVLQP